jgi:tetratricopeptide (TPR) repeat protein
MENTARPGSNKVLLIALALVTATLLVFNRLGQAEFHDIDDQLYVVRNPHVLGGLSNSNIAWAFTAFHAANWHPLTWMSLQLDAMLFGPYPAGYHLVNVLLHAVNAALVFVALLRLTAAIWRSAAVAALFALHPLHVESVAWVSERKDVLSTLFGLLALLAYARYVKRPGPLAYAIVVGAFALSLLAKPMLVTLPFLFLLLDWWPLERWAARKGSASPSRTSLFLEKVPLLVLSVLSCWVTLRAQAAGGAVSTFAANPLASRTANAALSYAEYLRQTFWPVDLAALYPLGTASWVQGPVLAGAAALAGVTAGVLALRRPCPYLLVGWLWYLGMLVPVIGLVQVGRQARADRYTYLPLTGIFIMVVWGFADLAERWRIRRAWAATALSGALLACAFATWFQVEVWRNSVTLWSHALRVGPPNAVAYGNLAVGLVEAGQPEEALPYFQQSLKLRPGDGQTLFNQGMTLMRLKRFAEAEEALKASLRSKADNSAAHFNLGVLASWRGDSARAQEHYAEAVRLNPDNVQARINSGLDLLNQGRAAEAEAQFATVARRFPHIAAAHDYLGVARTALGKYGEAELSHRRALELDPSSGPAWHNLAVALRRLGRWREAVVADQAAVERNPGLAAFRASLALNLDGLGAASASRAQYEELLRRQPDWPRMAGQAARALATHADAARRNGPEAVDLALEACQATAFGQPDLLDTLAAAYAAVGRFQDAVTTQKKALEQARGHEAASALRERLRLYENRQSYHEPASR